MFLLFFIDVNDVNSIDDTAARSDVSSGTSGMSV
jgi:hypothetical protein